jgi:hypothetical protein
MNNTCCERVLDNCQSISQCFETLTLSGLEPDSTDKVTFQDLYANEFVINITSDALGVAIVDLTTLPTSFFNSFSRVFFLFFETHVIQIDNKTYSKLLFKVENIQTNDTNATINV